MRDSETLKKLQAIRLSMNFLLLGGEIQIPMDNCRYFGIVMTDEGRIVFSTDPPEWQSHERTFQLLPWKSTELMLKFLQLDISNIAESIFNLASSEDRPKKKKTLKMERKP